MRGWVAAMLLCVAAGSVATGARASSASVTPGAYPEARFAAGSEPAGGYEAARGSAPAGGSEPARSSTLPTIRLEARDRGPVSPPAVGLSAERARLLLRSLTLPGWAELSAGRRTSATVFGLAELSVWTSFTAFRAIWNNHPAKLPSPRKRGSCASAVVNTWLVTSSHVAASRIRSRA